MPPHGTVAGKEAAASPRVPPTGSPLSRKGSSMQHKVAASKYSRSPSTLIPYGKMSFLIIDAPVDHSLPQYIAELRFHNVTHLVRACEATYSLALLLQAGIAVHDMSFPDGEAPPKRVVEEWLALVDEVFGTATPPKPRRASSIDSLHCGWILTNARHVEASGEAASPDVCVAVHCQAGLGRAPALVAIALMERGGVAPLDAIAYIRERRKGAFNAKQMAYLEAYSTLRKKPQKCRVQ
jgi:protein tyrosine phosphatase type 4A